MDSKHLEQYFIGKATEEEKQKILNWLDSDPEEHIVEMNRLYCIYLAAQLYGDPATFSHNKIRRFFRPLLLAAASVAVLVGVWFASDINTSHRFSGRIVQLEAPAGQRLNTVLEDGTRVSLNAGTTLEYPAVFARGTRRVKLSGEALFEVEHDAERPFIVETFASDIEVRGTRFNVEADAADNWFSVLLAEGSVEVRSRLDAGQTILMEPYERVELVGDHLCKTQVKDFDALCWTEGIVLFGKMPFDRLMQRLERAYNIRIIINKDTLPQLEVRSGKLRVSDGIEYAMHVLQQLSDFTYRFDRERNIIEIQ